MIFKNFYKKGCDEGYITDTTINENSYQSVQEAIEAGIITNVSMASKLYTENNVPEIIDGKANIESNDVAQNVIDNGAVELNFTTDLKTPTELNIKNDSKLIFNEKQTSSVTINSDSKNLEITTTKELNELNINAPETTVNITGTIDKINAVTADYTLVLNPGTIVNNLNVKAGNILVHKGASIKNITKDPTNKKESLVYTMGNPSGFKQDIPTSDSFKILEYKVSNVIDRGGKMILNDDAKLSPMSSSEFFGELDLNGHNLTVMGRLNSAVIAPSKSLKIYNGTITTTDYKLNKSVFKTSTGSTLNFDKVKFITEGTNVFVEGKDSHLVVNESELKGHYAVATNASDPQHLNIDLTKSTFNGMSTIFVNVPCNLNINECNINGNMHGVIVRGGTANINNSNISMNYTDDDFAVMANYFNGKDWASGNTINLAGLVMGNKDKTAYKYPTTVNLKNTNISIKNHDDLFPVVYAWAYDYPVTFNYDDKCKFTGQLGLVYGNESNNITVNK